MQALTAAGLITLTSQPPTLEELFLRHYGAATTGEPSGSDTAGGEQPDHA